MDKYKAMGLILFTTFVAASMTIFSSGHFGDMVSTAQAASYSCLPLTC